MTFKPAEDSPLDVREMKKTLFHYLVMTAIALGAFYCWQMYAHWTIYPGLLYEMWVVVMLVEIRRRMSK